jgi:hypothetical protein
MVTTDPTVLNGNRKPLGLKNQTCEILRMFFMHVHGAIPQLSTNKKKHCSDQDLTQVEPLKIVLSHLIIMVDRFRYIIIQNR